jgi:hypothetical protein
MLKAYVFDSMNAKHVITIFIFKFQLHRHALPTKYSCHAAQPAQLLAPIRNQVQFAPKIALSVAFAKKAF